MRLFLKIGGEWRFAALDGATRKVKRLSSWSPNLVTDIGLDRIGSGNAIGPFVRIGTGTTAAAAGDTALVSQAASTSTVVGTDAKVNEGSPTYATTFTRTVEFPLGAVVGNMGEIGLGWSSSGASLFSRARIVDGGGTPTTISVLVSEILQATYRLRVYPVLTDASGTVDISGTSHSYVSRVRQVDQVRTGLSWAGLLAQVSASAYNGALGATTDSPSGSSASVSAALSSYTNGTYYRDFTVSASISQGNLAGGISAIATFVGVAGGTLWETQTSFSPAIAKDGTNQLSLPFRISWARH